jgi:hypothetical protein
VRRRGGGTPLLPRALVVLCLECLLYSQRLLLQQQQEQQWQLQQQR